MLRPTEGGYHIIQYTYIVCEAPAVGDFGEN